MPSGAFRLRRQRDRLGLAEEPGLGVEHEDVEDGADAGEDLAHRVAVARTAVGVGGGEGADCVGVAVGVGAGLGVGSGSDSSTDGGWAAGGSVATGVGMWKVQPMSIWSGWCVVSQKSELPQRLQNERVPWSDERKRVSSSSPFESENCV